jgi:dihydrofolate synthase / folylpolyglutamate synthase
MAMRTMTTYASCLNEMYGLRRFGIKLGLGTIRRILSGMGDPHKAYRCIHVAGTNGKGSIASALATILNQSGHVTGLYTSPHLVRFNERIRIDGKMISDREVVESYLAVKDVGPSGREPTFFEFATAMAMHAFKRHGVEWAVIETGMGGRLDATNIIRPAVSVISNLSIEHKQYLGNTLAQIAFEKGGIIKYRTPVVTGVRQKQAVAVLERLAQEKKAPLHRLGVDFSVRRRTDGFFDYQGLSHRWTRLQTGLQGDYQIDNAAIVLAACETLIAGGTELTDDVIHDGILRNIWPGRLEVVCERPYVIIDGAHNLMGARELGRFLRDRMQGRNITLVMGILDDKPFASMMKALVPCCRRLILTAPKIDRRLTPQKLYRTASAMLKNITVIPDVAEAAATAIRESKPDDVVCIAGSLYVVGEFKEALQKGRITLPNGKNRTG